MSIYVVGSSRNKFLPLDDIRTKFLVDRKHEGPNIDGLNPMFCELTGLFHMWKNCNDDIVGLEHYRRYLSVDGKSPVGRKKIEELLDKNDVLTIDIEYRSRPIMSYFWLSKPELAPIFRDYITHLGAIIGEKYARHCEDYLNGHHHVLGNMFISKRELMDEYCKYLFGTLMTFNAFRMQTGKPVLPRMFGYFSEFLLGAYLDYNKKRRHNLKLLMI